MPDNRTDEQLLQVFAGGSRRALGEIARRYERPLLGLVRGLLGGRTDLASDAVQETWIRVIRFGHTFDGRSRFKTWLYRIALNQCRNMLSVRPPPVFRSVDDSPAGSADATRAIQDDELRQRMQDLVEQLPSDRREIVLVCYHGGLTHDEAAEILDIPLGTLKSRLHAALKELRERLAVEMQP